jgi:hypothetical protein
MATSGDIHTAGQRISLLPALAISTAVSATATTPVTVLSGMKYLAVQANFLYGADGTTVKAYVQTSLDGGSTWLDIMSFAFATTAVNKVSAVVATTALAAAGTPTDGSLADNTILNGLLGDRIRVKYVTTGTYSGATSLEIDAIAKA